jgi:hypothetical protein
LANAFAKFLSLLEIAAESKLHWNEITQWGRERQEVF